MDHAPPTPPAPAAGHVRPREDDYCPRCREHERQRQNDRNENKELQLQNARLLAVIADCNAKVSEVSTLKDQLSEARQTLELCQHQLQAARSEIISHGHCFDQQQHQQQQIASLTEEKLVLIAKEAELTKSLDLYKGWVTELSTASKEQAAAGSRAFNLGSVHNKIARLIAGMTAVPAPPPATAAAE
eukprot:gnl/Hemi2/25936_TR8713_c1_g14_i1.p1 gnl/Hemi2/25936_TR8713_c1_g14~~gnl/Hemi2/25936_TR8713_c1_g14_i1.p1  ORF type:complete len:187 (-),score=71.36 gnl/Hemi2/25936_TR8713_c1_g14_i1:92-652(-)